jgi:hypothetical protein
MLDKIKQLDGVGDIFIVDNGSDYAPLLEWYETKPCEIIRLDNIGHTAPWHCGLVNRLNTTYVVTDSDLGLDGIPDNTLTVLHSKLIENPLLGKVGLGLDWEIVDVNSPYHGHLHTYEKTRWQKTNIVNDVHIDVHIDTTFALYNRDYYFIGGGSLARPYVARHYPWEMTNEERQQNSEFDYYIRTASNSSSYKTYLGL